MVYGVIGCGEINKSCSGYQPFLIPIFKVLREVQELADTRLSWPETCLFMNEELIHNGRNTIKYESFKELVCVASRDGSVALWAGWVFTRFE